MISISRPQFAAAALFAVSLLGVSIPQAHAQLTLTPAGVADGFTLDTFVGGYNFSGNYGPLAQGILPNGNVITGSMGDATIFVFPDSNNLTLGSAISATPYAFTTSNPNWAMATAGDTPASQGVYGAQLFGGVFVQFNSSGGFTPMTGLVSTFRDNLGMWGDPVNGHLIAASQSGLIDITPSTGAVRSINASLFPDGVTVSPDGTKIYGALGGNVVEIDMTTGNVLATFNGQGRGPDGTGVLIGGLFNGDIIVNNNDGTVGLIDPTVGTETIIAGGGTRGDFVSADTSNGTLFLSQLHAVDRLGCGPGCSISVSPGVPEPSTWAMMLIGFAGLGFAFRQSRRKASLA